MKNNLPIFLKAFALVLLCLILSACEQVVQQMGPTEYGLRFRKLPPVLGGGLSNTAVRPGELAIVWPWDSLYTFDTSVQDISWGGRRRTGDELMLDYLYTRALDGNEVALAVTVRYQITDEESELVELATRVATSNKEVDAIVMNAAKADIRTYMNGLRTASFLADVPRYRAVDRVKEALSERLGVFGIKIIDVNLNDFKFERLLEDGSVDRSYQEALEEIQRIREDTERERSRIETVRARKEQAYNVAQAGINRIVAEAYGYKDQAELRGNAFYETKTNEAKGILALGQAEVEGMIVQIEALSGSGGAALLKLEIAERLLESGPNYILLSDSESPGDMEVRRTDTNELLQQIGILEGLRSRTPTKNIEAEKIAPALKEPQAIIPDLDSGEIILGEQTKSKE